MTKLQEKASIILAFFFLSFLPLTWAEGQTAPATSQDTVQMKATVVKIAGDVRIRNRGNIFWRDAKVNEILAAGDQIETKEKGKIELRIENGNVINLKPKSKLVLKTLTKDLKTGDYENLFEAPKGKLRAQVEKIKGSSKFEVKTPTAVACVRGTIMYLLVYPDSTTAFFEEGVGFVTNPFSGQTFDVDPGNVYQIDENGNVTGPVIPTSEQLQDIIEGWDVGAGGEGYSEPEGGDDLGGDTGSNDNSGEAMDDILNSLAGNAGPVGNNGGGGTITLGGTGMTTDTDGDGLTDEREINTWQTDPLVPDEDVDDDHIPDIEDAFAREDHPKDVDLDETNPDIYGSRDSIRNEIKEIIEGNDLRAEIQDMIDDTVIRNLDARMEEVTDAMTGKVLTDAYGYRVRVEQYVLRPNSNTVELLNISLRTQEAGSLAGLSTLDWKTTFNNSLDGLNSGQIKNLPWNYYLDSYGLAIVSPTTPNNVYPTNMSVELKKGGNYLREDTAFGNRFWFLVWLQGISTKTLSFNLTDIGSGENLNIKNRVTDSNPTAANPVSIRPLNEINAPDGFRYHVYFGPGDRRNIYVSFNVIADDGTNLSNTYKSRHFDTLGDALRVNLDSPWWNPSSNIGSNNLEITVSSKRRNAEHFSDSRLIDVIYVPMPRMEWNDRDWNEK